MTLFLWIIFTVFVFENAFLLYNLINRKSIKQDLAETKAKLKVAGVVNEMLNRKIPGDRDGRLRRFEELASRD